MYCKNCGKEIADDSKFCQHCGTAQQQVQVNEPTPVVEQPKKKIKLEVPTIETNLSDKAKIGLGIYIGWVLLNFLCIFLDYSSIEYASEYFYPFYGESVYHDVIRIWHYDFTEFLVYTILAPLAIYGLYKLWKYLKK